MVGDVAPVDLVVLVLDDLAMERRGVAVHVPAFDSEAAFQAFDR